VFADGNKSFFGFENKRRVNDAVFAYAKIFFAGDGVGIVKAYFDRFVDYCSFINLYKPIVLIE
jgi:hypothetical protein